MLLVIIEVLFIVLLINIFLIIRHHERQARRQALPQAKLKEYWGGGERRRYTRFTTTLEITYTVHKKPYLKKNGTTINISEGGAKLLLNEKLEQGAIVVLRISLPNTKTIEAEGEVVWHEDADEKGEPKRLFHSGIRFRAIKEPSKDSFAKFIRSIAVETEP